MLASDARFARHDRWPDHFAKIGMVESATSDPNPRSSVSRRVPCMFAFPPCQAGSATYSLEPRTHGRSRFGANGSPVRDPHSSREVWSSFSVLEAHRRPEGAGRAWRILARWWHRRKWSQSDRRARMERYFCALRTRQPRDLRKQRVAA